MIEFYWESYLNYIFSENTMYHPKIGYGRNKRPYPFLYKDPGVGKYQEEIKEDVKQWIDFSLFPRFEDIKGIVIFHKIGLIPEGFWIRDVENTTKAINDAIFSLLNETLGDYDDAHIVTMGYSKIPSPSYFIKSNLGIILSEDLSPHNVLIDFLKRSPYHHE